MMSKSSVSTKVSSKSGGHREADSNNLDNSRGQDRRPKNLLDGQDGTIVRIKDDNCCLFRSVVEACKFLDGLPEHFKDHASLRIEVVKELGKDDYNQSIINTLMLERGLLIEADILVDENWKQNYLKQMLESTKWGPLRESNPCSHRERVMS